MWSIVTTAEELRDIIARGEGEQLEFKNSDILSNPKEIAILLTSLANTEGGMILIGVNDDATPEGMKAKRGHEEHIMNVASDRCVPPIRPSFEIVKFNSSSDIYVIQVPKGDTTYGVKIEGGLSFYKRVGSTCRYMTAQEITSQKKSEPQVGVVLTTSDVPIPQIRNRGRSLSGNIDLIFQNSGDIKTTLLPIDWTPILYLDLKIIPRIPGKQVPQMIEPNGVATISLEYQIDASPNIQTGFQQHGPQSLRIKFSFTMPRGKQIQTHGDLIFHLESNGTSDKGQPISTMQSQQESVFTLNDTAWRILNVAQSSFINAMSTNEIAKTTGLASDLVFETCVILRDSGYLIFTDEFKDIAMVKITGQGLQAIRDQLRSRPNSKAVVPQPGEISTQPVIQNRNEALSAKDQFEYDVFICHSSEDKDEIARPLAEALRSRNLKVWYDEFTLKLGDSLRRTIDRGLASSRYGVVILSPSFFNKNWAQKELDGLAARGDEKVILPIWHRIDQADVLRYSPMLADKLAVSTENGLNAVINAILEVVIQKPNQMESRTEAQNREYIRTQSDKEKMSQNSSNVRTDTSQSRTSLNEPAGADKRTGKVGAITALRRKYELIMSTFANLEKGKSIRIEDLITVLSEKLDRSEVDALLRECIRDGVIYAPKQGYLKRAIIDKPRTLREKMMVILSTFADLERELGVVEETTLYKALSRAGLDVPKDEAKRLVEMLVKEQIIYSPIPGYFKRAIGDTSAGSSTN